MGVDHGGLDIFVTKELLDGANVIAVFEEVRGEAMAEGVGGDGFIYFRQSRGFLDGLLKA